ncbi:MAG: type II toxin-antitoxin system RelE/ParE family toxin [Lautropia sp.]|nr:type II toxin-antitoxin system RelE/ParE family toxin [Lautropia sp.]
MNSQKKQKAKVVYTKAAQRNLLNIVDYVNEGFGRAVANRVLRNFVRTNDTLATFHHLGMVIEENPRYRKMFVAGRNMLVYRVDERSSPPKIVVVAIYVARQNINYSQITG